MKSSTLQKEQPMDHGTMGPWAAFTPILTTQRTQVSTSPRWWRDNQPQCPGAKGGNGPVTLHMRGKDGMQYMQIVQTWCEVWLTWQCQCERKRVIAKLKVASDTVKWTLELWNVTTDPHCTGTVKKVGLGIDWINPLLKKNMAETSACDDLGGTLAFCSPPSWLPERCATGMPRGLEARFVWKQALLVLESENLTLNIQNRVRRSSKVVWNTSQNKTWKFESKPVYISDSLH